MESNLGKRRLTQSCVLASRKLLGAVNFYRDMWPQRAHFLAPLTSLTGSSHLEWTAEHDEAFDRLKQLLTHDTLLYYTDPNKPFHIYTDASDLQLGAIILQENHPVVFYSRKLSPGVKRGHPDVRT